MAKNGAMRHKREPGGAAKTESEGSNDLRCYSDARAAEILGCSRRHILNLRARGVLPFVRFGRRTAIRHLDLLEYLQKNRKGGWAA